MTPKQHLALLQNDSYRKWYAAAGLSSVEQEDRFRNAFRRWISSDGFVTDIGRLHANDPSIVPSWKEDPDREFLLDYFRQTAIKRRDERALLAELIACHSDSDSVLGIHGVQIEYEFLLLNLDAREFQQSGG